MDEEIYLNLLSLVTPLIKKQNTIMRESITPSERSLDMHTHVQICLDQRDLYKHAAENVINLHSACTITMLAQNYHTDAQVCLYKKIVSA